MQFGSLTLRWEAGTLTIAPASADSIIHYPGTKISSRYDLGTPPTIIRCVLLILSNDELYSILEAAHVGTTGRLTLDDPPVYYESVLMRAETSGLQNVAPGVWRLPVTFTCLDPIPYNLSGVRLYG